MVLLPAFSEMASSLADAMNADSRDVAERVLQRFAENASEAEALLGSHVTPYPDAIKQISDARTAAAKAIDRLYQAPDQTTTQRVGSAAASIRAVATTLNGVHVLIRNEIGTTNAK